MCLVYSHYTLCRKLNVIFNVWFNLCKKVCYFRHLIWWGNYIFNLWFDFLINVLSKVCFYKSHGTFILTELYWYSIFICMYQAKNKANLIENTGYTSCVPSETIMPSSDPHLAPLARHLEWCEGAGCCMILCVPLGPI